MTVKVFNFFNITIATLCVIFIPPTGQVTIPGEITFQLDTDPATDPPVFTLTCTSTGGPATTVSWRRDGTMLSDDSTYSITSQVTDTETATYTHTLRVTGRLVGEYQCSVSNIRTPSGSSRSLTVAGKECCRFMVLVLQVMESWAGPGNKASFGYHSYQMIFSYPQLLIHRPTSMHISLVPAVS